MDCNPPSPHFRVSGTPNEHIQMNGEVMIDLVTGLHWQRCAAGLTGDSCLSGDFTPMTWTDALAYCEGLVLGGHDDWYLPDMHEAKSIYGTPLVPTGSLGSWNTEDEFWTSVSLSETRVRAITPLGNETRASTEPQSVRCVRRGFSGDAGAPGSRFINTLNAQPTVTDVITGLTWQGCYVGASGAKCTEGVATEFASADAAAGCESLEWDGRSDWRLPSQKELFSLLNVAGRDFEFPFSVVGLDETTYLRLNGLGLFGTWDGSLTGPNSQKKYPQVCVRYSD